MTGILDETIGSLLRPVTDWFTDLSTRRSEPRQIKELRETLYGIVKAKSDAAMAKVSAGEPRLEDIEQQVAIGLGHCRNKIDTLDKATLAAVIEASSHPEYETAGSLRENLMSTDDMRGIAVYFDTLHSSGISRLLYPSALFNLSVMSARAEDIFRLHSKSPAAANALLRVVIHFLQHGTGVGLMHSEIKQVIMEQPDAAEDVIAFARQRKLACLNDLDPEEFRAVMASPSTSLRDGVL